MFDARMLYAIVVRPKGAATWQPRATPWEPEHTQVGALKGRNSRGPGMPQSLSMLRSSDGATRE